MDVYEIDLKVFKRLANRCEDNLVKFHDKIKQKIVFYEKRIKEINSAIKRKKEDTLQKDKFTKIFLDNYTYKPNENANKYINSFVRPLGNIKIKYNSKKVFNCSIGNISQYFKKNTNINKSVYSEQKSKKLLNSKSFVLSKKKLLRSCSASKENFFRRNLINELSLPKKKSIILNKKISLFNNNNNVLKSTSNKSIPNNNFFNEEKQISKGIKKSNLISLEKYCSSTKKNKSSNKSVFFEENEKNLFEKKIRNNAINIIKELMNEKKEQNSQKCHEMKKSFFFVKNSGSKTKKQYLFFRVKK